MKYITIISLIITIIAPTIAATADTLLGNEAFKLSFYNTPLNIIHTWSSIAFVLSGGYMATTLLFAEIKEWKK